MSKLFNILTMLFLVVLAIPVNAQVIWTNISNWEQVKARAKTERKLIFVDCFATWCAPCKKMDVEVYTQPAVYQQLNKGFINIKLQMDSTGADSPETKQLYALAKKVRGYHAVSAYPSYLFFTPSGNLIVRDRGGKTADKFGKLLNRAQTDGVAYGKQLDLWRAGKLDPQQLPILLLRAEAVQEMALAKSIAKQAIAWLSKQSGSALYDQEYIRAVGPYLQYTDKKLFSLFYPVSNGANTDSLLGQKGLSATIMNLIIEKDIKARLIIAEDWAKPLTKSPDWERMEHLFAKRYSTDVAAKFLEEAKRNFYSRSNPDWNKWAAITIDYYKNYGNLATISGDMGKATFNINNDMWYGVFAHVKDKNLLLEAADLLRMIVDRFIELDPKESSGVIDTYANLLYKAGRVQDAINWQEKAIFYRREMEAKRGDKEPFMGFAETLDKMKKGEATWVNVN